MKQYFIFHAGDVSIGVNPEEQMLMTTHLHAGTSNQTWHRDPTNVVEAIRKLENGIEKTSFLHLALTRT